MAPHDVGLSAEGVAITEEDSNTRIPVVDEKANVYVLHRVLYPQVHENGFKKKKKRFTPGHQKKCRTSRVSVPYVNDTF